MNILHFTGGCRITLSSGITPPRAIADTRMTIMQRSQVHGVPCDAACPSRPS